MSEQNKIEILNVLNSLEIIDQNGGDDAYMLVANTPETRERLSQLGVSSETIRNYGDDETFCILALAFGEGYATDYKSGVGLIYEEKKIDEIKEDLNAIADEVWEKDVFDVITNQEGKIIAEVFDKDAARFFSKAPDYTAYLLQEIERKDEALRFYADKKNWKEDAQGFIDLSIAEKDNGQRAREAL